VNTYFGLILSNYRFVVEVWYFRPVLTKGEVRRTLQVSRRCHNAPHIHRRETEVLRRMFFSGWITGTNISFTSGVGMTRCIPDVKNPRTTRGPSETKIPVRHRFLHAIFVDLPHWYRRARGTSRRRIIFVHSILFVLHRGDFGTLQPWTHAEGRAEHLVTRSDLAEEFRDVDLLRSGI